MTLFYVFLSGRCHYCQTPTIKKTIDNNATNNWLKLSLVALLKNLFYFIYLFIYSILIETIVDFLFVEQTGVQNYVRYYRYLLLKIRVYLSTKK